MSIYIGNQTAFFTANPEEPFEYAFEHNFTAFEWFNDKKKYENGTESGWGYNDITSGRAAELAAISKNSNIRFSVHAACMATPFSTEGMAEIMTAIEVAVKMKAVLVNIHLVATEGIANFARAVKPAIVAAGQKGLALAIENTPLHSPAEFNELFSEFKKLNVQSLGQVGMCIDIGHANCCEATRNNYIGFIDQLSEDVNIIHAHVHENWGNSDSHLALFTASAKDNDAGVRLFLQKMRERNFSGSLILEQWPQEHNVLDVAFERLCAMLGDEAMTVGDRGLFPKLGLPVNEENSCLIEAQSGKKSVASTKAAAVNYYKRAIAERDAGDWVVDEIIRFSKVKRSWRRRLEAVRDIIVSGRELSIGDLAGIAVYLRFLSTAEIKCIEDGGHYRPCHHAKAAQDIEEAIERLKNTDNAWILRRIYPYLPSHAEEFMRHEPLTRIRDIAHRNDIPKDLKLDIKHNLQNKLHRSAGPEDMITAKRILEKIKDDSGGYSEFFVKEFELFYKELSEFFNALGLEERLHNIKRDFSETAGLVDSFINTKKGSDVLVKIDAALKLRQVFTEIEVDASRVVELRLADVELEDFSFALISEFYNSIDSAVKIIPQHFDILELTLKHILLSEFEVAEVASLLSEFSAWRLEYSVECSRLTLLRLWASIQRAIRLCSNYADIVNKVFAASVIDFGKEFKIAPHAVNMYCEGDIRANIIFQLSKILTGMQHVLRTRLNFPPWSVVNGGHAHGKVVVAESLEEFEGRCGAFIVLLKKALGDEEIPSVVRGVLLAHPIAHLSHLGVRARSGRVPFAAAENAAELEAFAGLVGQEVALEFTVDGVKEVDLIGGEDIVAPELDHIAVADVEINTTCEVLNFNEINRKRCGAKSAASAEMFSKLSCFTGFKAPKVMALPYGVMECCFAHNEELATKYKQSVASLEGLDLDKTVEKLVAIRELIMELDVPESIVARVREYFGDEIQLAVRSSSSGEDLAGFAGAGLYDSIIGVTLSGLGEAIKKVWASLWTRRAVLSRIKYGLNHSSVFMGVLLQEVVPAEYSFVLHTANPVSGKKGEISIELAVGFGETLASANQAGSVCRITKNIVDGQLIVERCADLSVGLFAGEFGEGLVGEIIDYSKFKDFLGDNLLSIGEDLSRIGIELEEYFEVSQDIEGAFSSGAYYIVQSRAQAGIEE